MRPNTHTEMHTVTYIKLDITQTHSSYTHTSIPTVWTAFGSYTAACADTMHVLTGKVCADSMCLRHTSTQEHTQLYADKQAFSDWNTNTCESESFPRNKCIMFLSGFIYVCMSLYTHVNELCLCEFVGAFDAPRHGCVVHCMYTRAYAHFWVCVYVRNIYVLWIFDYIYVQTYTHIHAYLSICARMHMPDKTLRDAITLWCRWWYHRISRKCKNHARHVSHSFRHSCLSLNTPVGEYTCSRSGLLTRSGRHSHTYLRENTHLNAQTCMELRHTLIAKFVVLCFQYLPKTNTNQTQETNKNQTPMTYTKRTLEHTCRSTRTAYRSCLPHFLPSFW
jgi:hypothetical protein